MRALAVSVLTALAATQSALAADVSGRLRLVDTGPFTTPVEYLEVALSSLGRSNGVRARTDSSGQFILKDVLPGRYAFDLSFPGRFVSVTLGGKPVKLPEFDLTSEDRGPLEIVVTLRAADLAVEILGLPSQPGKVVAVLCPADLSLTLRYSCFLNSVSGAHTDFRFEPPGTYRLFVIDEALKSDVSGFAPRFPEFLKAQAPPFVYREDGGSKVTASYIDAAAVREAVRRAGPLY